MAKKVIFSVMLAVLVLSTPALAQEHIYGNETQAVFMDTENILSVLSAEDLGISEVRSDNIHLEPKGSQATYQANTTPDSVKKTAKDVGGDISSELVPILGGLLNGSIHGLNVKKHLWLYQATPVYANIERTKYITKKTISFSPELDKENVRIIEIFPSEVIANDTVINFTSKQPVVFSQNPVAFRWELGNVNKGEVINITYYINNLVVGNEGTKIYTVADGRGPRSRQFTNITIDRSDFQDENNSSNRTRRGVMSSDITDNLIATSIVFIILLLVGIAAMELEGRGTFNGIKNIYRDAEAAARIGFKNKKMIDDYVSECIHKGYHLDDIRITLLRAGWNRKAVRRIIEKYK